MVRQKRMLLFAAAADRPGSCHLFRRGGEGSNLRREPILLASGRAE
jgi:hypothetical protein